MSDLISRQAAVDLLDNLIGMVDDNHGSDYDAALRMGIEALKAEEPNLQQTCNKLATDCISRQAAIEIIRSLYPSEPIMPRNREWWGEQYKPFIEAEKVLEMLPSAEPERKKGKWLPYREKSREYIGTVLVNISYDYWFCNACGYRVENGQPMYNFCPNCGADMREEE